MPNIRPLFLQIDVALEPCEDVMTEPVGQEFHVFAIAGQLRRLIARLVPVSSSRASRARARRSGWGTALDTSSLMRDMDAAEPIDPPKRRKAA